MYLSMNDPRGRSLRSRTHRAFLAALTAATMTIAMLQPVAISAYIGLCCAKCGGNMPLNIIGAGVPETHEFRFKITPSYMRMRGPTKNGRITNTADRVSLPATAYQTSHMSMMHMGGHSSHGGHATTTPSASFRAQAIGKLTGREYMAVPTMMEMSMVHLAAGYSFTDNFFGGIMMMAMKSRMIMNFNPMMIGTTGRGDYEMKSEGMGDTMLMGKYRIYADRPEAPLGQVSVLFGLSLPTGSINMRNRTHPVGEQPGAVLAGTQGVDRTKELLPYAMQLGSGTFDPTLGLVYQGSKSPWWWGVNAYYTARAYRNKRDYALGDEGHLDVYVMYQVSSSVVLQGQLRGMAQGDIQGQMDEARSGASGRTTQNDRYSAYMSPAWDPENYGGEQVSAVVGVQWQPVPLQILEIDLSVPVHERRKGLQLKEEYRISMTYYFELPTRGSIRHPQSRVHKPKSKLGF